MTPLLTPLREKEIVTAALLKELLRLAGREAVSLDDDESTYYICRAKPPVLSQTWPKDLSPEEVAELERRRLSPDQGKVLFEFTVPDPCDESEGS